MFILFCFLFILLYFIYFVNNKPIGKDSEAELRVGNRAVGEQNLRLWLIYPYFHYYFETFYSPSAPLVGSEENVFPMISSTFPKAPQGTLGGSWGDVVPAVS